jgi:hypothetical protein
MARSHPHLGHYSQNRGTCPLDWLDSLFQLPADHHHGPGMSVWITTLPLPDQIMWHLTFADLWNASTGCWRQPSCAMQINIGQRHFLSFCCESAHLLKRICKHQSRPCVWRTFKDPRRTTDAYHTSCRTSAPHHTTAPAYGLLQASSSNMLHQSRYLYTQGSPQPHTFSFDRNELVRPLSLLTAAPTRVLSWKDKG